VSHNGLVRYSCIYHIQWLMYYGVASVSRINKIIHVSFAKEPYERDCILQKRPIISSILLKRSHPRVYVNNGHHYNE